MHYYKRNIGDYAKKAGRLSMLQHGAYTLLIDACYDREQFPTIDEAIEWTWASTTDEEEAVKFVLRKFFTLEGDRYVQNRIKEEIAEYHAKAETNKRIANEREATRRAKQANGERDVHGSLTDGDGAPPNHKPLTTNQEPSTTNQKKGQESSSGQGPDGAESKTGGEKAAPPADEGKKAGSKKKHGSAEDHEAARWIFAKLRINDPTAKEPNWDGWANEVRLMVERDARTHREICELFLWAQKHQFWCANILSPSKLREKWTQLIANQNRDMAGPRAVAVVAQSAEKTNAEARRLLGFAAKPGAEVIDG